MSNYMDNLIKQVDLRARIIGAKDVLILLLINDVDSISISIIENHIAKLEKELDDYGAES